MSTPPTAPPPPERISLAKIAAVLAIILVLAFGVCTVRVLKNFEGDPGPWPNIAIGIEILCVIGLIVITVIAIARRNNSR
jgi:hypothetical protein